MMMMMMMMMMISLCRMDTEVLMLNILNSSSIIVLSQVVLGRPTVSSNLLVVVLQRSMQ